MFGDRTDVVGIRLTAVGGVVEGFRTRIAVDGRIGGIGRQRHAAAVGDGDGRGHQHGATHSVIDRVGQRIVAGTIAAGGDDGAGCGDGNGTVVNAPARMGAALNVATC